MIIDEQLLESLLIKHQLLGTYPNIVKTNTKFR